MAGTKIQGYKLREITDSDPWVPAQLWVVTQVGTGDDYTIQNCNSRTYLTLGILSHAHPHGFDSWIRIDNKSDGSPIAAYNYTGNPDQHWVITRNPADLSYV